MSRAALAVTWWGHASATLELSGARVAVDPLLVDRLAHLRRAGATPADTASKADLVLVSHQHADHLHLASLRRFRPDVPVVGPVGAERLLARSGARQVLTLAPGDAVDVGSVRIEALPAAHAGGRHPLARGPGVAIGFRIEAGDVSAWYPGDTGLRDDMSDVAPVDLALVPVGGWGPTLPHLHHLSPVTAAEAVRRVGARHAVPVHWGTFWPIGLERVAPGRHHRLFVSPGERFVAALDQPADPTPVVLEPGERVELS
jgi:L-ascorbate metabolism protein UlaG (beta-lactamase superfamily)